MVGAVAEVRGFASGCRSVTVLKQGAEPEILLAVTPVPDLLVELPLTALEKGARVRGRRGQAHASDGRAEWHDAAV